MDTLTQPTVTPPSGDPPPITPYFRRCAELDRAVALEKALRGLLAA